MPFAHIANLADIADGENRAFDLRGRSILVCRTADAIYAVENRCSHAASPLEGGRMRGHFLICPTHGARFDLRDGTTLGALTKTPIATFRVSVVDGKILVDVGD